jgi:Domain of unknown function (DUF4115)
MTFLFRSLMQANLLELAKQGDPQAIATLMNQALNTQGVSIQATLRQECLHILMESQYYLEPNRIVPALRKAMLDLQSPVIAKVRVYGHHVSESSSLWGQVIHLQEDLDLPSTLRGTELLQSLSDDEPPTAIRAVLNRPLSKEWDLPSAARQVIPSTAVNYRRSTVTHQPAEPNPDSSSELDQLSEQYESYETDPDDVCGVLQPYSQQPSPTQSSIQTQPRSPEDSNIEVTSLTAAVILNRTKKKKNGTYKLKPAGIIGALICGIGLGSLLLEGFHVPKRESTQAHHPGQPSVQAHVSSSPIAPQMSQASPSPTLTPSGVATLAPTTASPDTQPIKLTVNLTGKSWMSVIADQKSLYEGTLDTGAIKNWTAKQALIVRVGNAGSVLASFNGAEAKALGQPGEVVELTWTPDGIKANP